MSVAPDAGVDVGIDIGGTSSHGVVTDPVGRVVAERVVPTGHGARALLDGTEELVHELLRCARVTDPARVGCVGIGVPGRVDPPTGVVETALNLGVTTVALGPLLSARLGVPVVVDNDVKATALGAAGLLDAMGESLTYVNVGTGVASATVLAGHLLRGSTNFAGEIGHLTFDPDGEPCACGQRGCIETVLGGRRLVRRLGAIAPGLTNAHLFDSALPAVAAERDRVVEAMARTLTTVAVAYGADRLLVGGGVVRHTPGLVGAVRALLAQRAEASSFLAVLDVAGRTTVLDPDLRAGAVGAAMLGAGHRVRRRVSGAVVA